MIGQAQSCLRRNRPVAWMLDALKNRRDIVPVSRPTAERDVAVTEDLALSDGCGSFIRLVSNFNIACKLKSRIAIGSGRSKILNCRAVLLIQDVRVL